MIHSARYARRFGKLLAAIALFAASAPLHAFTYKVGADSKCGFSNVSDAVSLAVHNSGYTTIYIASNQAYANQAITINTSLNSHITLVGGVADCANLTPTGSTTLNGNGSASVITVRGALTLTLSHLDITKGHAAYGGGIDYAAAGELHLDASTVEYNTATNGGGIRFQGYGGAADLYLHSNTLVSNNTAGNGGSGGGIRVEGNANLHVDEPNTWIGYNKAADKGGGIIVIGPAYAHVGSSGYGALGVVSDNSANYGGGMAVFANSNGSAGLDVFAADPNHPVRIERNLAYHTGGGVYLVPYIYPQSDGAIPINSAAMRMEGAHIDSNAAQEGAGIYADTNSTFAFVDYAYAGAEVYSYSGGSCATGLECNTVSDNRAVATDAQGNETATAGSAILIQTNGSFQAGRLAMRGNQGAHAIRVVDSLHSPLQLDTCLIADNIVYAELITLGSASASINQCTIAGNINIAEGYAVLRADADLTLTNSIVAQGTQQTLIETAAGASTTVDYVIAGETGSLGPGTNILQADPEFVDPGHGDFHLRLDSPAIDLAPPVVGDDRDLENRPRDQDLPEVQNLDGPRDLGAYERQLSACDAGDTIFCDGFEVIP